MRELLVFIWKICKFCTILLIVFIVVMLAVDRWHLKLQSKIRLELTLAEKSSLKTVRLEAYDGPGMRWIDPEAMMIILKFHNDGRESLSACRISLNDHYEAPIEKIDLYHGMLRYCLLTEDHRFPAGGCMEMQLSLDTNNYPIFKISRKERLKTVELICEQGRVAWNVE